MFAFALFGEIRPSNIFIKMIKTSINSFYPDLWPSRDSQLQGLTVVQQCSMSTIWR